MTSSSKRPDPFDGWITTTAYRDNAGRIISVRRECKCGWQHEGVTAAISREQAVFHVAEHGVTIEVSYGPPARRVPGTSSAAVPYGKLEERRAQQAGPHAVAALMRQRQLAARSGSALARYARRGR